MATAFTSATSIPSSSQWTPSTTHADPDPHNHRPSPLYLDDSDSSAYEDSPTTTQLPTLPHQTNGTPTNGHLDPPAPPFPPRQSSLPQDPTRAPLPIALHATLLSLILGASTLLTLHLLLLLQPPNPLWRLPFFATTLCTFHLLEFYTTALYHPAAATTSAFLLDNGHAYNLAHSAAFLECFLHYTFLPPTSSTTASFSHTTTTLGLLLLLLGQTTRTLAMAHAGPNFNHVVQAHKLPSHTLVTHGIYAWLRHPAYFGFFWWSLGSQLVLGNWVCFVVFAGVLGGFFRRRVRREEELLVAFFGDAYGRYRAKTGVGIPFVG